MAHREHNQIPTIDHGEDGDIDVGISSFSARPPASGLYDGRNEHDACGVAFVATMRGSAGHDIVEHALTALRNLDHRGATGADPTVGDGAGILTQVPDEFLRAVVDFELPAAGTYAVGTAFLPADAEARADVVTRLEKIVAERPRWWRVVDASTCG